MKSKTELIIMQTNKTPKTKVQKRIYKLINKYHNKNKINRIPHANKTHNTIYALYNIQHTGPQSTYVGKTTNICLIRRQKHITKAYATKTSNSPLSRYIRRIGPTNLGIIPLMTVPDWSHSHYFERMWIHKLESHISKSGKIALNCQREHKPNQHYPKSKKAYKNSKTRHNRQLPIADTKPVRTLIHLLRNIDPQKPPAALATIKQNYLYKLFSILNNKATYKYPRPNNNIINKTIQYYHNYIIAVISPPNIQIISTHISNQININNNLLDPYKQKTPKNNNNNYSKHNLLTLRYIHPLLQHIPLTKLFQKNKPLLPHPLQITDIPKIIYTNNQPTSKTLFNFKQTTQLLTPTYNPSTLTCQCHQPQYATFTRSHGHIDTLDLAILPAILNSPYTQELQNLLSKGTRYIETPQHSPTHAINNFITAINNHIQLLSTHYNIDINKFTKWGSQIITDYSTNILQLNNHYNTTETLAIPEIKTLIAQLHQNYVINSGDKLPGNYTISCKKWWLETLKESTLGPQQKPPNAYIQTNYNEQQITNKLTNYLQKLHFKTNNKLPTKRINCKYHKEGIRPLVSAPNVVTTDASKTITCALQALINAERANSKEFEKLHGHPYVIDIENSNDLGTWINELNNDPKFIPQSVSASDATGFYDHVQHNILILKFKKHIKRTFDLKRATYLTIHNNKSYKWHNNKPTKLHSQQSHTFTPASLLSLIACITRNQYLMLGQLVVKQRIGLSQGGNHCGHTARLLLIYFEKDFILDMRDIDPAKAKQLASFRRKHDDLLFINNSSIMQYIHKRTNQPGLYPKFITLSQTNINNNSANYLDCNVSITNNKHANKQTPINKYNNLSQQQLRLLCKQKKLTQHGTKSTLIKRLQQKTNINNYHNKPHILQLKTFNKKDTFPTNILPISYPIYTTNIKHHIKTGTITGALTNYQHTNSHSATSFINTTTKLFNKLIIHNLYPHKILYNILYKYINTRQLQYTISKYIIADKIVTNTLGHNRIQ